MREAGSCARASLRGAVEFESAEQLLREAAEIIEPTDYFIMHVDLRFAEAEVERLAGRARARAGGTREGAGSRRGERGHVASVARADDQLGRLA